MAPDPRQPDREPDSPGLSPDDACLSPDDTADGHIIVDENDERRVEDERVDRMMTHTIDVPIFAEAVEQQEAADAADTLELLDDEAADVLVAMDTNSAAETLAEMVEPLAASVLEDLVDEGQTEYAGELLHLMAPDDAADLLQAVEEPYREPLLATMPSVDQVELRELVEYEEESAAGLMTTEFLALPEAMTVDEAIEAIRASELPEEMTDLPVVGDHHHLLGLVSLRDLLLANGDRLVLDIADQEYRAIRADLDQESVAREFHRYDLHLMPVVDRAERLLGVITVDDIIDIIREEQTEDVQRSVGAGAEEAVYSTVPEKFRGRFPWLVVSLITLIPATLIVLWAEGIIDRIPIVAAFMPIVAALAGNAGHQALAVTLRGIVLDEVRADRVGRLVRREALVGLLNGLCLGTLVGIGVTILSFFIEALSWRLGIICGISMIGSLAMGTLAGTSIPIIMRRSGADPAQSSAIFLIMITDFVGLATFLGLATALSPWIVG